MDYIIVKEYRHMPTITLSYYRSKQPTHTITRLIILKI